MSIVKKHLFLLICLISAVNALGQAARSPFSRQGIGEAYGNALGNTQGSAGIGVSQPQFWFVNNQNPALLVYNSVYSVFQAGLIAERKTIRQDSASEKSAGGNLNYLVTAFPVKPTKWTTSLGLMPFTSVKYKIVYLSSIENSTDTVAVKEEGSGGLTQLYWSNGIKLARNLAVGLKVAYIFGSIRNTYATQLLRSAQSVNYEATIEDKSYVRDFAFTAGVSYSIDSLFANKKYRLNLGATYTLPSDLNTNLRYEVYRSTPITGPVDQDTLSTISGKTYIPGLITGGVSLGYAGKWSLGTEFSYQDWSKFKAINQDGSSLGKSWRIAFGGETTPDIISASYLKRVTYRAGVSYEQTPFLVDVSEDSGGPINKKVNDIGINFGFSLPAGRSSLDVAFKYGKRGNKTDTLLSEDYFRIFFGITFNDQWFIKRRFD